MADPLVGDGGVPDHNNEEERRRREEENRGLLLDDDFPQDNNEQLFLHPPPLPPPPLPPKKSFFTYRSVSFMAFFWLVYSAFRSRQQYYLAMVYLSTSKWAYVVTGNAVLALASTVFDGVVSLFLGGGLRQHEAEGLQDFFRWNVTETCLALTMFRAELTVSVALKFVALILVKCLHHVAGLREVHLRLTEEAVSVSSNGNWVWLKKGHAMIAVFLLVLSMVDLHTLRLSTASLLETWPSVSILFAFEATIMLTSAWSHQVLWLLHVVDSILSMAHEQEWGGFFFFPLKRLFHPWKEHKATLIFAVELQAQAVTFLFYCTFFAIVLSFYGMPINLFREVYMSFTALQERLGAFLKYRRLMASMDRFQAATEQELNETEETCIICRDVMHVGDCKKLPGCGHIFHKSCLREWLVQQQTCPTCRSDITAMEARERERSVAAEAATERTERDANIETTQPPDTVAPEGASSEAKIQKGDYFLYLTKRTTLVWDNAEGITSSREIKSGMFCVGKNVDDHIQIQDKAAIRIPDGYVWEEDVERVSSLDKFDNYHSSLKERIEKGTSES